MSSISLPKQNIKGVITNIQRFSVNDGPGIRSTVFMKGCPLSCEWCHNPECLSSRPQIYYVQEKCAMCGKCVENCAENAISLEKKQRFDWDKCVLCMRCIEACPNRALIQVGYEIEPDAVLAEVESDLLFYKNSGGGLTVSGGEPLFQYEFVTYLFKSARQKNISTALDTSGYVERQKLMEILNHVDLLLYDIKHVNPTKHKQKTGRTNKLILENVKKIAEINKEKLMIRIPIIPGFNDSVSELKEIADFIKPLGVQRVDIFPYHRYATKKYDMLGIQNKMNGYKEHSDKENENFKNIFESYGFQVSIGG